MDTLSGSLLVLGPLIYIGSLFVLFVRADFQAMVGGSSQRLLKAVAEQVSIFKRSFTAATVGVILVALGFVLLTRLLIEAGGRSLPLIAATLFLIAAVLWGVEHSIHVSITLPAAEKTAAYGAVPSYYEPVLRWANILELIYIVLALLSAVFYGWSILQTGALPLWVGWVLIGWSILWLIVFTINPEGITAVALIPPLLLGIVIIVQA
jgi:hypothetical protein